MDITDRMHVFREATRHLWNTDFRHDAKRNQDWDLRDSFSDVYVALFKSMVKFHLPDSAPSIPHLWDSEQTVLQQYHVMGTASRLQIMINRDKPASGYWDYPKDWVDPTIVDLRLISIFDWDNLGFMELRYFRVRIVGSDDADIVDRDALVEVENCRVEYISNE